jgi:hypothetical protein
MQSQNTLKRGSWNSSSTVVPFLPWPPYYSEVQLRGTPHDTMELTSGMLKGECCVSSVQPFEKKNVPISQPLRLEGNT